MYIENSAYFFRKETKTHIDLCSEIGHMCRAGEMSVVYIYQLTYCSTRKFILGMLYIFKFFFLINMLSKLGILIFVLLRINAIYQT